MGRVAVFAVLLALLTWFLHRRLVRATGIPRRWARLADTALVVLAVSTLIGVGSGEVFPTSWARPIGFVGWVWLASWLYLIPGLLVIGLFAGIGRLRARHTDTTTEVDPAKRRTLQLATAAVTLAAIGTAGYGVYEASGPKISRVRVPLAREPIDIRRLDFLLPVAAEIAVAEVVGEDKNEVRSHRPSLADARTARAARYSALMPASRMMAPHRACSVRTTAANVSGESPTTSPPCAANHSRASGDRNARTSSALSLATMSLGVAAGAATPIHALYSYPARPDSANVGTSGAAATRCLPVTARARSFPAFTCGH